MMMTRYQISNTVSGTNMGIYNAKNPEAAIHMYVRDAGYKTLEEAADVCHQTVEELIDEIYVTIKSHKFSWRSRKAKR